MILIARASAQSGSGRAERGARHEINGLLFAHRDPGHLARQMQRFADDPELARRLGERGYAYSPSGEILDIAGHVEAIYGDVLRRRAPTRVPVGPGPWRITFDTNPDDCNLHCIMCEEHSPLSPLQDARRAAGKPPRRMGVELIRRVLADSRGTGLRELIPSTMGVPLLYPRFKEIIELCAKEGVKLNLTTNGTSSSSSSTRPRQRTSPPGGPAPSSVRKRG